MKNIIVLVHEMRLQQKEYFKLAGQKKWSQAQEVLKTCKALERAVDEQIVKSGII
jgi:hypothetical protein